MTASVWITLIISAERCIFITWFVGIPGNKNGRCPNNTKAIVISVFMVSFVFNIPFWFDYDVDVSLSTGILAFSEFSESTFYEVWLWIRLLLVKILPIGAVVIFNCIPTWDNSRKCNLMNIPTVMSKKRQNAQTRMTAMLTSISTVFLICHSLESFVRTPVYTSIAGHGSTHTDLYNILVVTVNIAESFASNFISYWVFNSL